MPVKKLNQLKILAVIGIRSGSSSIKDKNIKILGKRPLVEWIIRSAKKSKLINRIAISTDSKKYAKIVKNLKVDSYIRPKNISGKFSKEIIFIKYLIKLLKKEKYNPDIIVRLLATCPFQKTKDIDIIIKKLIHNKKLDSSVIVSEAKQHPAKALKIVKNKKKLVGYLDGKGESVTGQPRQIFEKAYFRANAIAFKTELLKKNTMTGKNVGYHLVSNQYNIDIDTPVDFKFAEFLIEKNLLKK
jgi:CMP-N,N'-diacetyllegionaminic acid synthase